MARVEVTDTDLPVGKITFSAPEGEDASVTITGAADGSGSYVHVTVQIDGVRRRWYGRLTKERWPSAVIEFGLNQVADARALPVEH